MRRVNFKFVALVAMGGLISVAGLEASKKPQKIQEYGVYQQFNDGCMWAPMYNRILVQEYVSQQYDDKNLQWRNRKEWLGEGIKYDITWRASFLRADYERANQALAPLSNYLDELIKNGPTMPHFYSDNKGIFSVNAWTTGPLIDFASLPFLLIDVDAIADKKVMIGGVIPYKLSDIFAGDVAAFNTIAPCAGKQEKNDLVIERYNAKTAQYEKSLVGNLRDKKEALDRFSSKAKPYCCELLDAYAPYTQSWGLGSCEKQVDVWAQKKPVFGSWQFLSTIWPLSMGYQSLFEKNIWHQFVPYCQGLYKLMLLTLGLDSQNNPVVVDGKRNNHVADGEQVADVMIALHGLCNDGKNAPNHPWRDAWFKKEFFLQYALAEILKEDGALKQKVAAVVDRLLFTHWKMYQKVLAGNYYTASGKQMIKNNVQRYIVGEEQLLAYALTEHVRLLWYGALSREAFNEAESIPKAIQEAFGLTFKALVSRVHNPVVCTLKLEGKKRAMKVSFLGVWQEVLAKLGNDGRFKNTKNWISFDAHGWVVSTDPELIKKQNSVPGIHNKKLLEDLGIAGFDSWLMNTCPVFFKK
jgi:hypothetical protein